MILCGLIVWPAAISAAVRGPYELYARPIRLVINRLGKEDADFKRVCELMREGRNFRYRLHHPYRASSPEITEALRAGCCKDKSLWLAARINDASIRYVYGRARPNSPVLHAWLLWDFGGYSWVLDCTNHSKPLRLDRLASGEYVAMYQWKKGD